MSDGKPDDRTTRAHDPVFLEICARIAGGESVAKIMREPREGYPSVATWFRWLVDDAEAVNAYERATRQRAELYAEEATDIVDAAGSVLLTDDGKPVLGKDGYPVMVVDRVAIEHAKLRSEVRRWNAARMLPKRFGDRTILTGDTDNPIALVDGSTVARKLFPDAAPSGATGAVGSSDGNGTGGT